LVEAGTLEKVLLGGSKGLEKEILYPHASSAAWTLIE
jgi:hypothetical protein